jgi:hypothetical protein
MVNHLYVPRLGDIGDKPVVPGRNLEFISNRIAFLDRKQAAS